MCKKQSCHQRAAISALLPLFKDNAHSVAMIKHSMTMVQAAVQHLNPGQVPVITADQPLFALAKQIQWTWPSTLGENHFVHRRRNRGGQGGLGPPTFLQPYIEKSPEKLLHIY